MRIAKAAEEQRLGFEQYIEARLEFSEFLLAREPEAGTGPEPERSRDEASSLCPELVEFREHVETRPGSVGDSAAMSGVFGLTFMHERKHVRELEAARDAWAR